MLECESRSFIPLNIKRFRIPGAQIRFKKKFLFLHTQCDEPQWCQFQVLFNLIFFQKSDCNEKIPKKARKVYGVQP